MPTAPFTLAGQIGTPGMVIRDDPRADPRMLAVMAAMGMDGAPPESPFKASAPLESLLQYCELSEAGFGQLGAVMSANAVPIQGVTASTEMIKGVDGNDISLYMHRPTAATGNLPCILHIHGGGMAILEAAADGYVRWRDELAATGLIVVGVEFRNSAGKLGPNPFPAGLNDCTSALQWIADNKARLGISKVIVSGESGGGNLTIATTLKASREGRLQQIDGVYAQCPYISGAYDPKAPELQSLVENDGYFLGADAMAIMAKVYDPIGAHTTNPLAWPYYASVEDLRGLPPHVISVNELDPLRDEGLAYYRKLLAAGVSAVGRTVQGTCHAGDCIFRDAMPEVYLSTIHSIKSFADSLLPRSVS
jgi:acetyl esterase